MAVVCGEQTAYDYRTSELITARNISSFAACLKDLEHCTLSSKVLTVAMMKLSQSMRTQSRSIGYCFASIGTPISTLTRYWQSTSTEGVGIALLSASSLPSATELRNPDYYLLRMLE